MITILVLIAWLTDGTPLPTGDPDNYFFLAGGSAIATLMVLFLGAAWPAVRTLGAARRKPWTPS